MDEGHEDDGGMEEEKEAEEEEEEALAAVGVEWRGLGVLSPVPERCFLRRV